LSRTSAGGERLQLARREECYLTVSLVSLTHERRILLMALAAGAPGAALALLLLWRGAYGPTLQWTLTLAILACWVGFSFAVEERVAFPLKTLSNLLAAFREGDYSIRGRREPDGSALGEVMQEVNALAQTLREQRLGAVEASALLSKVMAEIDVAIFAFDADQRLRLVNRAGERLLAQPAEKILTLTAAELGIAGCLEGDVTRTLAVNLPGSSGRWQIRRSSFRERGLPHQLLVLSDLSRALRDEEREAWQRLLRVLGHELNNSLAPIQSIAGSLGTLLSLEPPPEDWREDMHRGLAVIGSRSAALGRFMGAYAQLARLPQPRLEPVVLAPLVRRVVQLETRLNVVLAEGPDLTIQGDRDQLEQLLINLLRNAVDAALETGGGVQVGWSRTASHIQLSVVDEGPGLPNTSNLFVPFFTTKQGGSGVGLVLSRQIAEAHGGSLTLQNRPDRAGCEAQLRLPL